MYVYVHVHGMLCILVIGTPWTSEHNHLHVICSTLKSFIFEGGGEEGGEGERERETDG